jgi:hypothetical protein
MQPRGTKTSGDTNSIRLIPKSWVLLCSAAGLDTDAKIARAFQVAQSTILRVTTDATEPSPMFIATACKVLGCKFDELFAFCTRPAR